VRAWETGRYDELLPNEYYRGVWFFEQFSDTEFLGYGDAHERDVMYYESDVVLKGWLNVKKLGYPEYASARMLLELTQGFTAGTSPVSRDAGRLSITANSSTGALVDVQVLRQLRHGPDVFSSYPDLVPEVLPEFEYFGLLLRLRLAISKTCYHTLLPDGERFAIMDTSETGVTDTDGNIITGFET